MQFANGFLGHLLQLAEDHQRQMVPGVVPSAIVVDLEGTGDLRVVTCGGRTYACRVRRHDKLARYSTQFTLRWCGPDGDRRDEIDRVLEGQYDYLIYGYAPAGDTPPWLAAWCIVDLDIFRLWHQRQEERYGMMPGRGARNPDGTHFRWYELRWLPQAAVPVANLPDPAQMELAL
jgi:hypothetical protein